LQSSALARLLSSRLEVKRMLIPLLFAALPAAQDPTPPAETAAPLLSHAELTSALNALAAAHPERAQVLAIGTSRGGRAIVGLRISAPTPPRPAILLVANLEGPRVFESSVALAHARKLADGYATDERVRDLLDRATLYVIPRANPDGAEAFFENPKHERAATGAGVDDDRDGRQAEDAPADVNGDGAISELRVLDPEGTWILDPADPRAMVEADPAKGERGAYKLWVEGRDLDGDERIAEDARENALVNRNFPAGFEEHLPASGLFPGDEPETRALMDFVLLHEEIVLVLCYDGIDALVDPPSAVNGVPSEGVLESDAKIYAELGKRYRDATGNAAKSVSNQAGSFQRWCYEQRGILALAAVLWECPKEAAKVEAKDEDANSPAEAPPPGDAPPAEAPSTEAPSTEAPSTEKDAPGATAADEPKKPEREPSDDAKRLDWIDSLPSEAWRFLAWTPFDHPELGAVEIGGFAPYARMLPPQDARAGIELEHFEFLLGLVSALPKLEVAELELEALGSGGDAGDRLVRVKAAIENGGLLASLSHSGERARMRPGNVRLVLPGAGRLVAGRALVRLERLRGAGGRQELEWLVSGPPGMEVGVEVDSARLGLVRKTAEVPR
jgi:hypothetical protein